MKPARCLRHNGAVFTAKPENAAYSLGYHTFFVRANRPLDLIGVGQRQWLSMMYDLLRPRALCQPVSGRARGHLHAKASLLRKMEKESDVRPSGSRGANDSTPA